MLTSDTLDRYVAFEKSKMGVDLKCIFENNLSNKEIVNLPQRLDSWKEIRNIRKNHYSNFPNILSKQICIEAKWDSDTEIDEKVLSNIFHSWENPLSTYEHTLKNKIQFFIGQLRIYKNVLVLDYSPEHKYGNIHDKDIATQILNLNRIIAKKLGSIKILYCPDSNFPTAQIYYKAQVGYTVEEAISFGKSKFGNPPEEINDGMKFMFFIDDFEKKIDNLKNWEWKDLLWRYNELTDKYEIKNAT